MSRFFSNAFIILFSISAVSCGGSGGESKDISPTPTPTPTPTPEPENSPPVANSDTATAENNQDLVINVLLNDSDADGDELSISAITSAPEHGEAIISDDTIIYTPSVNYLGTDSLSYSISDGSDEAQATINLDVVHNIEISGSLAGTDLTDAEVAISIDEEVFKVLTGSDGTYSAIVSLNSPDSLMTLSARGIDNSDVHLNSYIGKSDWVLSQVNNQHQLTSESTNSVHISPLSTVLYLYAKELNGNTVPSTRNSYISLLGDAGPNAIVNYAALITLLIDDPNYTVPAGSTTQSLFSDAPTLQDSYNLFLREHNLINAEDDMDPDFLMDLRSAIVSLTSDNKLSIPFQAEEINDKRFIGLGDVYSGMLAPNSLTDLSFDKSGSGVLGKNITLSGNAYRELPVEFNWTIEAGHLSILNVLSAEETRLSYAEVQRTWGQDVADFLHNHFGHRESRYTLSVKKGHANEMITQLAKTDTGFLVNVNSTYIHELLMPEDSGWQGSNPVVTDNQINNLLLTSVFKSKLPSDITIEDLNGDWIIPIEYSLQKLSPRDDDEILLISDKLHFDDGIATGMFSEKQFTVELDNGTIILQEGNVQMRYTPFEQKRPSYLAYIEKTVDGVVEYHVANRIAKFEPEQNLTNNLITELPIVANPSPYLWDPAYWENGKLSLSHIFASHFQQDGKFTHGISFYLDRFSYNSDFQTSWSTNGSTVTMLLNDGYEYQTRTWEVIGQDSNGHYQVFEYAFRKIEVFGNDEFRLISPRISYVTFEDLSRWPEYWDNTTSFDTP